MGTHIKFRLKTFSVVNSKEVKKFVKTPTGLISVGALSVSSANLATNMSRHRSDRKYQGKQIEAMDRLTRSINGLDNTVKAEGGNSVIKDPKPKYINFRLKQ